MLVMMSTTKCRRFDRLMRISPISIDHSVELEKETYPYILQLFI